MVTAITGSRIVGFHGDTITLVLSSLGKFSGSALTTSSKVRINHGDSRSRVVQVDRHGASLCCTSQVVSVEQPSPLAQKQRGVEGRLLPPISPPDGSEMGLTDSSLSSTLEHRLWLGFGASVIAGMVLKAGLAAHAISDVAGMGLGAAAAYVLADLGTGVYHWGIDNYGDSKTPVFGSQIDAFQGHHKRPWTISKREFANNLHALARPAGFFLLPFLALPANATVDTFLGVFLGLVVMSQQIHAWAHSKKSQIPPTVNYLQESGVLISRKMHGIHHKAPYSVNYCIVSGLWNATLNDSRFFPQLEAVIYSRWGVVPRNWTDTAPEWKQDGSYFEDGSDFKLGQDV